MPSFLNVHSCFYHSFLELSPSHPPWPSFPKCCSACITICGIVSNVVNIRPFFTYFMCVISASWAAPWEWGRRWSGNIFRWIIKRRRVFWVSLDCSFEPLRLFLWRSPSIPSSALPPSFFNYFLLAASSVAGSTLTASYTCRFSFLTSTQEGIINPILQERKQRFMTIKQTGQNRTQIC